MKHKVLVVEDSKTSLRLLKRVIGKANLQAVDADSLTQAKHIFAASTPEEYLCAVIDYTLPDAPNGEAIDFAIASFIPVIVITGYLDEEIREQVLSKEVVDYIPKENTQVYEYLSRLLARLENNKHVGVLVVDDSRISRKKMTSLLRRHNFITYEASCAEDGLMNIMQHNNIKLVITDENMPDMSGIEMVSEIRRAYNKDELAIIGVSSQSSKALSARFIKSGANDYLTKPFYQEEFLCRVMQNVESIENIGAIRRAANSDYLTGLPNRRHFFARTEAALRNVPEDMTLALIDLDHFKAVNDTFGHDVGDMVLKDVAKLLAQHFRGQIVARFGGEEFCVFLPGVKQRDALSLFESFGSDVRQREVVAGDQIVRYTLSVGLTSHYDDSVESMLKRADLNLYKAKEQGRDCIVTD